MADDARSSEDSPLVGQLAPTSLRATPPRTSREQRWAALLAAVSTMVGAIGTALSPMLLLHHPEWLLGLSPDMRHIMLTATSLDLRTVLLICVPRRVFGMYAAWAVGAAFGGAALGFIEGRYPRVLRLVRFIERAFLRTGPALLVVWPSYTLSSIAGVVRTPLGRFLAGTTLGQVGYVLLSFYFGREVGDVTDRFLVWLRDHVVHATLVCVGAVGLQVVLRLRRRARERRARGSATEQGASTSDERPRR
ncbi:MAG: hypothetical protein R3B40_03930 [Polyangiales bacterium]